MPDKTTMFWDDWRGKRQTREVKFTLDIRDFEGLAGYPWLVIAANPHLSISDIREWLGIKEGEGVESIMRTRSWIQRKFFLFRRPRVGPRPHRDGRDALAFAVMQDNPTLSARRLSRLLKDKGINRDKNWVIRNRGRTV